MMQLFKMHFSNFKYSFISILVYNKSINILLLQFFTVVVKRHVARVNSRLCAYIVCINIKVNV
jgi:hypothetical protein